MKAHAQKFGDSTMQPVWECQHWQIKGMQGVDEIQTHGVKADEVLLDVKQTRWLCTATHSVVCLLLPSALTSLGQVIHLNCESNLARKNADMTVPMKPPMKPSHVFLGDNFIRGVRPKKKPACTQNRHVDCHGRHAVTVNWLAPQT